MKEGIDLDFFYSFFHINIQQVSVPTGSEDFGVSAVFYRTNNVVLFKVHLDSLKHFHFFGPLFKKYL